MAVNKMNEGTEKWQSKEKLVEEEKRRIEIIRRLIDKTILELL